MLGLRDVLFIAPQNQSTTIVTSACSDHHNHHNHNHHHHQTNIPLPSSASLGVGLGIFPLLTATPCVPNPPPPLPPQPPNQNPNPNPNQNLAANPEAYHYWSLKKFQELSSSSKNNHGQFLNNGEEQGEEEDDDDEEDGEAQMVGIEGDEGNVRACKDCGNRAKKDCGFRRCRTCCKARGFNCSTHVKSTWVPASRRRERHEMIVLGSGAGGSGGDGSSGSSSAAAAAAAATAGGVKRLRILVPPTTQIGNNSHASHAPKCFDFGSVPQDASFKQSLPGKVRSPAVFRCHRVTAINNGESELAYQATVRISGHIFKGYLYDHGVDEKNAYPRISVLNLEASTSRRNGDSSSSPIVAPSNACPASAT